VFGAADAAAGVSSSAGTVEAASSAVPNTISSADLAGIDAAAGGIGGGASLPDAISISTAWDAPATAIESATQSTAGLSSTSNMPGLLGSTPSTSSTISNAANLTPTPGATTPDATANVVDATGNVTKVAPPSGTDTNAIAQWWSKQPEAVKNRILQMGGNFASGLFDGWSQEQKLALQREQMNLDKQKYDTMMANGSAQPKLAFQAYKPTGTGLLSSQKG
jgi:hypothetical protein